MVVMYFVVLFWGFDQRQWECVVGEIQECLSRGDQLCGEDYECVFEFVCVVVVDVVGVVVVVVVVIVFVCEDFWNREWFSNYGF